MYIDLHADEFILIKYLICFFRRVWYLLYMYYIKELCIKLYIYIFLRDDMQAEAKETEMRIYPKKGTTYSSMSWIVCPINGQR